MKLASITASFVSLLYLVTAHPVDNSDEKILNKDYSLPSLLNLKKLPANWISADSTLLEEGRVILTPKKSTKGSLWVKTPYKLESSFTLEWTFRSVDYLGDSDGGLAFWIVAANVEDDKKLYNGPSKFDGLQLLVDNHGPLKSSIRGQLNDGSQVFSKNTIYDQSFASCLMGYQDSSVPTTARLTYDKDDNNLLKLQIDNKVCFQTRNIKFPTGEYRIGASAENVNNNESFEILKMRLFNGVIEESLIPNVNAMAQPKMLTKIIDSKTGQEQVVDKTEYDAETNDRVSNYDLYKKLDRVEGKVLANDIVSLEGQLKEVAHVQEEMLKYITHLTTLLNNQVLAQDKESKKSASADSDNYKDFLSLNEKLENMMAEQEKIRENTRHDLPMGPHADEIVSKLAVWLLPLIFIMFVMAYYTFRIRQELVKTKFL